MDLVAALPLIYTAHSEQSFYCRDVICDFVVLAGFVH